MSIFRLKPDPVVGIDIGSTAVKLLELSKVGDKFQVESYAMEPLPENSVEDKDISELDAVAAAISSVVKRAKPRSQYAAIAVAGRNVITKTITMNGGLSDQEIQEQIEADPASYIGQEIEDIEFDFQMIGPNEKEPDRVDYLLAACRSETLEIRTNVIDLAGLKEKIVDIEKYALENAFMMVVETDPDIDETDTIALVEIGATTTSLSVLGDQKIVYLNEQIFGSKQLIERVIIHYELSYEEADRAIRNGGFVSDENALPDYETEIIDPFKEETIDQISLMIKNYNAHSSYGKLSQILIAGGCASIPGLVEDINAKLGGHITIVNPFSSMSFAPRVSQKALRRDAPALMIACGLALRTFDKY